MSRVKFVNLLLELVLGQQVEEVIDRWKNQPQPPIPPQPTPPKAPVPIEQQPSGPVIQPKPKEPTYPSNEQILAFVNKDSDLQSLIGRYSNTINRRYAQPLDSMYNPQGQKFLHELDTLVKTKLKA